MIDRTELKNIILAVANQILTTCSDAQLENAVAAFMCGDPIRLQPHKPIDIQDYGFIAQRIERALTYRPKRRVKPKPTNKPSNFPNLFTVTVPMKMDVSKLSSMERQILYQNLDKMLLVTMHPPLKRTKESATMRAKIGIPVRHLWPEQKKAVGIKEDYIKEEAIEFYKDDVLVLSMIFVPIMHHFYKTLLWKEGFFGIPP